MTSKGPWQKAHDWAKTYYGEQAVRVKVDTGLESVGRWYEIGRVIYEAKVYDKDGEELGIDPMLPVYQALFEDEYTGNLLGEMTPRDALNYMTEEAQEQAIEQLVARDATYDLTKPPQPRARKKQQPETI